MDGTLPSISAGDLAGIIGTAAAPIVIDVRSAVDLAVVDRLIPGSIHHPQSDVQDLRTRLPATRPIVVCDLSGGQASWTVVGALQRLGVDARYLADGFAGWRDRGLPTSGTSLPKAVANSIWWSCSPCRTSCRTP